MDTTQSNTDHHGDSNAGVNGTSLIQNNGPAGLMKSHTHQPHPQKQNILHDWRGGLSGSGGGRFITPQHIVPKQTHLDHDQVTQVHHSPGGVEVSPQAIKDHAP